MFRLFKRTINVQVSQTWFARFEDAGLSLTRLSLQGSYPLGESPLLAVWLEQLHEDDLVSPTEHGYLLPWGALYTLQSHREQSEILPLLLLPEQSHHVPVLASRGSLEDEAFSISLVGWREPGQMQRDGELLGAVLRVGDQQYLLNAKTWAVVKAIKEFARRPAEARNGLNHRLEWGRIRSISLDAGAVLDAFLRRTVVLTPEKLAIGLRKNKVGDDTVIEIEPTFEGAPPEWLERFDRQSSVQSRYDIPTPEGIVQVVIGPQVRTVLEEVKRLDHRRVSGSRAQAFILNPYAALGADASAVIDEAQFESARAQAGLDYERFLPQFERDGLGEHEHQSRCCASRL